MQFILMNYIPSTETAGVDANEVTDMPAWRAYTDALVEAGVLVGGEALHPADTATTVRMNGTGPQIADGPYTETKEMLGGFYVIDVPDLDTALEWAARNPAAKSGAVEVRPVVQRG